MLSWGWLKAYVDLEDDREFPATSSYSPDDVWLISIAIGDELFGDVDVTGIIWHGKCEIVEDNVGGSTR